MTSAEQASASETSPDPTQGKSRSRLRGIVKAALSGFLGKGVSLLVNAATVPLTVRYLGPEGYGLWITISSTVTMFFVLDIGIANTLTNLISETYARDDRRQAASYFATAFWLVSGITALIGIVGWVLWPHLHWLSIFHVQDSAFVRDTSRAMAAAFIVFLFALPTGLAAKVLGGYQELHAANLFSACGSIMSLLGVLAVIHMHGRLPLLVAVYAGSAVAANAACMLWLCLFHKPWMKPWPSKFKRQHIGTIFRSGGQFFAIQLAGLIVFSSDNLIISHYLSPAQVTPYSVAWRLTGYLIAVQSLIVPALWPAYAEAWASGHMEWIQTAYRKVRWVTIVALSIGCAVILTGGQEIIRVWAGPAAVPSRLLLELMCVWMVICAVTINQACLMGATYRVGKQAISSGLAAVCNLILSIYWVRPLGTVGVLLATIVSYVVFVVIVQMWEVRSILRTQPSAISSAL